MGLTIIIPAGIFRDCLRVREPNWSAPEGADTLETHAPGMGLTGEDLLQLVAYGYNIFNADKGKMNPAYKRDCGD